MTAAKISISPKHFGPSGFPKPYQIGYKLPFYRRHAVPSITLSPVALHNGIKVHHGSRGLHRQAVGDAVNHARKVLRQIDGIYLFSPDDKHRMHGIALNGRVMKNGLKLKFDCIPETGGGNG